MATFIEKVNFEGCAAQEASKTLILDGMLPHENLTPLLDPARPNPFVSQLQVVKN